MKRLTLPVLLTVAAFACGGDDDDRGSDPTGLLSGAGADGGAAGSGGNGSNGNGGSGGVLDGTCEAKAVNSGRIAPDILIVLDRSGSMRMNGVNRWDPSVAGIKSITSMLQDRVSFGLMTFPGQRTGGGGGGGGGSECSVGSMQVESASNNASAIATALDRAMPGGRTPTSTTLAAARAEFAKNQTPDAPLTPKYVLLVTDGAPNCIQGAAETLPGAGQAAAVEASVTEIKALTTAGVKTYVLGFDTQDEPQLKAALDQMAAQGGTGDTAHRAIEDEKTLVDQFKAITEVAISCEFVLDRTVNNPRNVKVLIDGKQITLDTANGFKVGADQKTVTLQGDACKTMKQEGHTLAISVECSSQVPI